MKNKKETYGQQLIKVWKNKDAYTPIDIAKAVFSDHGPTSINQKIQKVYEEGKKEYADNFYIVCLIRGERFSKGTTVRNQVFHQKDCPTPTYDQNVFKYDRSKNCLIYLWSVPDIAFTHWISKYYLYLPLDQQDLAYFCRAFLSGGLDRLCARENKEEYNPDIKIVPVFDEQKHTKIIA